ncbi:MAG: hypothetical protein LQ340_002165, partial [Diploschistes diacapsis]
VFKPTEEFQIIHEDQEIPPGLHIRLNLETGLKEAKIYDGEEDSGSKAIEIVPEDSKPVAEPLASPAEGFAFLNLNPKSQQLLQPAAEDHGNIRPPALNSPDGALFTTNLQTLTSSTPSNADEIALLPALENLEDVSHDIYWGLNLAKDATAIPKLDALLSSTSATSQLKSAAALLLGTAIQNNPAALSAALSHFYNDSRPTGLLETVMLALIHEQVPALTARLVYLLSALCQDRTQLANFVRADGLDILRSIYDANNSALGIGDEARDRLKQKVSNFVLDHFLTEDSLQGVRRLPPNRPSSVPDASGSKKKQQAVGDDSAWILVESPGVDCGDSAMQSVRTKDVQRNMAAEIFPWCNSFRQSLENWGVGAGGEDKTVPETEKSTAQEHVEEAYGALGRKLAGWGCGCEDAQRCEGAR